MRPEEAKLSPPQRYDRAVTEQDGRLSPTLLSGAGELFALFRGQAGGLTKSQLARMSGLSRTTINQRLEPLLAAGLLLAAPPEASTGGRPADRFVLNEGRAVVLVADMGTGGLRTAVCDLAARVLGERSEPSDITTGPVPVLTRVAELFAELLAEQGRSAGDVCGIGVDVPGPVDHARGRVVSPPIMTGWHDYDIPGFFRGTYGCPVLVENDVNAMAYGEQRLARPDSADLVFVKFGTGIGLGIIAGGGIYRGADGSAGDIGHMQIASPDGAAAPLCRCGKTGCVEAYAGGWALRRDLAGLGLDVAAVGDIVPLTLAGQADAARLFARAVRILGTAVSDVVNLLNPRTVVLGGQLAAVDEMLFAGIREVVYRRSPPLSTRRLELVPSTLGTRVGIHGLTRLVLDGVYSPARVAVTLS